VTSHGIGEEWEEELAGRVGGKRVPGSGSQWHSKLDVKDVEILWSAKATEKEFYRLGADVLREAELAARGFGSLGCPWAIGLRIGSVGRFVVMDLDDFIGLMQQDISYIKPDKTEALRKRARTPQLLRGDGDG
jgi:hypothetical protein